MAKLRNVHPRNVVKISSVALIVAMVTSWMMYTVLAGVYGLTVSSAFAGGHTDFTVRVSDFWQRPSPSPMTDIVPWIGGGLIFMVIMDLLHARFLWMPDPLMSIVAWDWVGGLHGTWAAALICGIVKWLVLRIGGSRLYEEKAVPFVGGFIVGAALNALIAGILAFTIFPQRV